MVQLYHLSQYCHMAFEKSENFLEEHHIRPVSTMNSFMGEQRDEVGEEAQKKYLDIQEIYDCIFLCYLSIKPE